MKLALFAVLALAALPALSGAAGQAIPPYWEKTITSLGTASIGVEPDLLVVQLGVLTQDEGATEALTANSEAISNVIESLKSAGVPDEHIGTLGLSIYPVYEDGPVRDIAGYRVANTVSIETDMIEEAAELVSRGVDAGANTVDRLSFTLSPGLRAELTRQLVADAVIDAREKAEAALAPLDQQITGVKSVLLVDTPYSGWEYGVAYSSRSSIVPDSQDVAVSVTVVFLIGDAQVSGQS